MAESTLPLLRKYPRTPHLEGSRLQPGDEDLEQVALHALTGRYVVVEEKVDGANAALRLSPSGELLLQSRGHYLTGGPRERHFHLFKRWAHLHAAVFREALGTRYILYGEWLYARHTLFYDRLPHYFLEFDVLDLETGFFLSSARRREMLTGLPLVPVPVLREGACKNPEEIPALIGPSRFIGPDHLTRLRSSCESLRLSAERVLAETDPSQHMEGIYIKIEEDGQVKARFKFIRPSFHAAVAASGSHWLDRPIVPNQLAEGASLF